MRNIIEKYDGCYQGWEECVCLDMNQFYLGLVSEEERRRVESLEPFDEHEVSCRFLKIFCYKCRHKAS